MLDHLRRRLEQALASAESVTLATYGPADIQAGVFPCEAADSCLYLLVPRVSDHLLNIERNPQVLVITGEWQLRGIACGLRSADCATSLDLSLRSEANLCHIVQVCPQRLHIAASAGRDHETIDVDELPALRHRCDAGSAEGTR